MDLKNERNLSMLVDFYELTMSNGYYENGYADSVVYCDMFFRKNPDEASFSIVAGLQQFIEYIKNLSFSDSDIEYLRQKNIFNEEFLKYLRDFKFSGDIYAIPEGTVVFPNEPITAANGRVVMDLGARRGQGADAAILGARAAIIGGVSATATTITGKDFGVDIVGTMAHSWVQFFGDEYKAFEAYAKTYPDNCILLVDTYSVLKSGIPNAIRIAKEILEPMGKRLKGIRLDSGDLSYLSKKARKMLDENGLRDCKILASNSLDEFIIRDLVSQDAKIDIYGVGERLITAKSEPVFGGVYKLMAVEENGEIVPRIKLSENVEKVTNPGYKQVWRLFDKESNKAIADVITLADEVIDDSREYEIFDPVHTWKKKLVDNFYAKKLQVPVFINGECVYESPAVLDIKAYCRESVNSLWDEQKRFTNPQEYYVDLSSELWNLKNEMINKYS